MKTQFTQPDGEEGDNILGIIVRHWKELLLWSPVLILSIIPVVIGILYFFITAVLLEIYETVLDKILKIKV